MIDDLANISAHDLERVREIVSRILRDRWGLSTEQVQTLYANEEELIVTSRIYSIYRATHLLFQNEQQADSWIHRPNNFFEGITALDIMLGSPDGLKKVQKYLCSQLV